MIDKDELLRNINYFSVYSQYFSELKGAGDYEQVISPWRSDETKPSFTIYWKDGSWYDFGTGETGDIIAFIQKKENYEFKDALDFLAKFTHLATDPGKNGKQKPKKEVPLLTKTNYELLQKKLQAGQSGFIAALLKRRKISLDVCRRYKIGAGVSEIIFPFEFENENVSVYKKFWWKNDQKHTITRGHSTIWPRDMLKHKEIILCEGEMDCLSLISNGFNAVTGTAGASTFKAEWGDLFIGKDVTIIYDRDDPGDKGAQRAAAVLWENAASVSIASWDIDNKGYDAGDFFESDRPLDELIRILDDAKPWMPLENKVKVIRDENESRKSQGIKERLSDLFYDKSGKKPQLLQVQVAEYIKAEYNICSTDAGSRTVFYRFGEGYWERISAKVLFRMILDLLLYDVTSYTLKSIIDILASLVFVRPEKFDSRGDLINLNNCAYSLTEFRPVKHDPKHYFTFKNDYDYDPEAVCPKFDKALWEYSKHDPTWIDALYEIMGYCMTGGYEFQKMFWFTGSHGGNGKGTVCRVMQKMTGLNLTKPNLSPSKLDGQFYKTALIGKRLAITGDLPPYMKNIDSIKELTGGDRQSTDIKFGDQQDFENSAKLVIAMNRMPVFSANEAIQPIMRRVYLLPFDYRITKYDHSIEEGFARELPGIFNRSVEALQRLKDNKDFTSCKRGKTYLDLYAGTINSFHEYINTRLEFGGEYRCWLWEIWEDYSRFMTDIAGAFWFQRKEHISNRTIFGNNLREHLTGAFTSALEHCPGRGKMTRYLGVKIKVIEDLEYQRAEEYHGDKIF